ncbi:MAG: ssuC [Frankiales bacterium]|nr:ssuC [Frankiales bacterium]
MSTTLTEQAEVAQTRSRRKRRYVPEGYVGRGRDGWDDLPRRAPARRAASSRSLRQDISPLRRRMLSTASFLVPLVLWEVLSATGAVDPAFLPSPGSVLTAGIDMAKDGTLLPDTWASVRRVTVGFGIAVALSLPLGFVMGAFKGGQAAIEPAVGLLRYMPATAFIPLLLIWFGLGETPKIALLVIGTVFFMTLMVADSVRLVPRDLLDVSATLGARRGEVLRKVVLPHALPGIVDAVRVNAAAAWNLVVVAELLASTSGLGYRIVRAQRFLQTDRIFAVLVVIGVIGLVIDLSLRLLRDRLGRWAA